jgi:two-component system sensor histidine kinase/response regulator
MKTRESAREPRVEILIAEDSPTQAEKLKNLLEGNGFQVRATSNGREALGVLENGTPTLIISDIVMPEMDGFAFCKEVKSCPKFTNIPVILLTSLSGPQDIIQGLQSGADGFIKKPYNEAYLLSRVKYILSNRELRKTDKVQMGMEIEVAGQKHFITSERQQMLDLLISTFEEAVNLNKELTAREKELKLANQALEREIRERKRAEEETRKLNVELASANKELESFSYSVSHDLQAPLRSINGFSQALREDYRDKLEPQAQDYLQRVCAATLRMEQLIHDLLQLSRVARSELQHEVVDLSGLARAIANELNEHAAGRQVEFSIEPELKANGDSRLLRVALENLLSNAWKFTGKKSGAKIEFGAIQQKGKRAYFIRDNGAGFNMDHANRLFGAFQRLHNASDYPGTGVGLATVQRIMHRHGGQVWAESTPGNGATFYFSL